MVFSGAGAGTEGDPYVIKTLTQLQEMKDYLSAYFILANNINAIATEQWGGGFEPIGISTPFTGSFDGQGYRITNLYINRPTTSNIGLFSSLGTASVIKNIKLKDVNITGGNQYVGALVGLIIQPGTVSNCYSTGSVSGITAVGGLVGNNRGDILDCYSRCSVMGTNMVGGLAGNNNAAVGYGTTTNSYSAGVVIGGADTGGLVGWNDGVVTNSFWDIQTSGWETSSGGTGKTTEQMKDVRTYTFLEWSGEGLEAPVWDFRGTPYDDALTDDIWDINPVLNDGYPYFNIGAISPFVADLDGLKARLLITGATYDTDLSAALEEAIRYAIIQILVYDSEFNFTDIGTDTVLFDAIQDIAAGIFKRRHMPQDMDQGWWAQGIKKLELYITSTYKVGMVYFSEE